MLAHSGVNESVGIVPTAAPGAGNPLGVSASLGGWLTLAFLWIPAVYFLARMRHIECPSLNHNQGAASTFR